MKNKVLTLMGIIMCLCLTGCSSNLTKGASETTEVETTETETTETETTEAETTEAETTEVETTETNTDNKELLGTKKFYSDDNLYSIEINLDSVSDLMTLVDDSDVFWFKCSDKDKAEEMFVRVYFEESYDSRDGYFSEIKDRYKENDMIVQPTEYKITVNGEDDYMLNYFLDSNHSSGDWNYYYQIDGDRCLIINAYGINEGLPGFEDLAEKIIDTVVSNSVISKE